MTTETGNPVQILLVEDNPGDVRLTREALKDAKISNTVTVAKDGMEAMQILRREGVHAAAPRPDLIMLDLNLPKKSGLEVLNEIKNDDALRMIPVVVLTSSQAEQDIVKSYNHHANCYITKPIDLAQFFTVVRSVEMFWFNVVKMPPRAAK